MIDTVFMFMPTSQSKVLDISSFTKGCREIKSQEGKTCIKGYVDNILINSSSNGINIRGSLSEFFYPNNIYTLRRSDIKEVIEKLSDITGIKIDEAIITRIDIAEQFNLKHPINRYLSLLGECSRFKRIQCTEDTVYYNSGKTKAPPRQMCFYDKIKDMQAKNKAIPEICKGLNMLRYEMRYRGDLKRQFEENKTVRASSLYSLRLYTKLVYLWNDNYKNISKMDNFNSGAIDKDSIKTVDDGVKAALSLLLNKTDPDFIQQLISSFKDESIYNRPEYYTRLKNRLIDISKNMPFSKGDNIIDELNSKINNTVECIR